MIIGISGKIGSGKDTIGAIITSLHDSSKSLYDINDIPVEEIIKHSPELSNWQIKKFADKLKDIVCLLIGCTREQLEDQNFKNQELEEEWKRWFLIEKYSKIKVPICYYGSFSTEEEVKEFINNNKFNHFEYDNEILTPRMLLQFIGTECGRTIIHPNIWINATFARYRNDINHFDGTLIENGEYPNWIITDVRFPNEAQAIKDKGGILIRVNRPIARKLDKEKDLHASETSLDLYKDWNYVIENDGTIPDLIDAVRELLFEEKLI